MKLVMCWCHDSLSLRGGKLRSLSTKVTWCSSKPKFPMWAASGYDKPFASFFSWQCLCHFGVWDFENRYQLLCPLVHLSGFPPLSILRMVQSILQGLFPRWGFCCRIWFWKILFWSTFFLIFLSFRFVWWCPLPVFPGSCNFLFHQMFWCFPDLVVLFLPFLFSPFSLSTFIFIPCEFFTPVLADGLSLFWVNASLFKSPGVFSVFRPTIAMNGLDSSSDFYLFQSPYLAFGDRSKYTNYN